MNFWKEIKGKTWIDWIKVVVAIDIAGVGIGLILDFNLHVFAYVFGFLSRIIFGMLYVFVAVLIFKRVFPEPLADDEQAEAARMDDEIKETSYSVRKALKKIARTAERLVDTANERIDRILDKSEDFIGKRKKEIKEEIDKITK